MAEEWVQIAKAAADARDDLKWCYAELMLLMSDSNEDWDRSPYAWTNVKQLKQIRDRISAASDRLTLGLKNRGQYTTKVKPTVNGNGRHVPVKATNKRV